jgi:hypothetical protein
MMMDQFSKSFTFSRRYRHKRADARRKSTWTSWRGRWKSWCRRTRTSGRGWKRWSRRTRACSASSPRCRHSSRAASDAARHSPARHLPFSVCKVQYCAAGCDRSAPDGFTPKRPDCIYTYGSIRNVRFVVDSCTVDSKKTVCIYTHGSIYSALSS